MVVLGLIIYQNELVLASDFKYDRADMISRELDCVASHLKDKESIAWSDVCYTKEEAQNDYDPSRDIVIEKALKKAENKTKENPSPNPFEDLESQPQTPPEDINELLKFKSHQTTDKAWETLSDKPLRKSRFIDNFFWGNPAKTLETEFNIFYGYRVDDVDFNIAGDIHGNNPNIISELTWKDVESFEAKVHGKVILMEHIVLEGWTSYGTIFDGEVQDSDYSGNNRTGEFSRSLGTTDEVDNLDISGGIGYRIHFPQGREFFLVDDLYMTFLGGYSHHEMELKDRAGIQTIPNSGPFSFQGTNSIYSPEWEGLWLGLELNGKRNKFLGMFRFEYHNVDFSAEANWSLRTDFQHPKSFEHIADGYGLVFNFGMDYEINDNWTINLRADIQDWKTDKGIIRFFLANGGRPVQQLNEVNWESMAIMLGTTYRFSL